MSVMTDQKYESEGGPGATDIVHFMRDNGLPEDSVHLFFKALVFNYIIAGGDAHAKNYAILEPIGGTPHLAPLYDIASYFAYDTQRKERKLARCALEENIHGNVSIYVTGIDLPKHVQDNPIGRRSVIYFSNMH